MRPYRFGPPPVSLGSASHPNPHLPTRAQARWRPTAVALTLLAGVPAWAGPAKANRPPVVKAVKLAGFEDAAVKGKLSATDADRDPITFRITAPPAHGEATVDARTGAIVYRGARDSFGADAFTVEASDGKSPVTTEVTVAITAVNDAPSAATAIFRATEDTAFEGAIAASDADGDALKYTLAARPKHGEATVDAATGVVSFIPAKDFFGDDAIAVDVSDGKLKATAKIAIKVAAVNDGPAAAAVALSTSEDQPVNGQVTATDIDSENLVWKIAKAPAHGEATVDAFTGAIGYRPAPNANGPDAFTIEVSDGALSATAEVTIAVAAVNDAPVARSAAVAVDEDGTLTGALEAMDADGDALTYRVGKKPKHGSLEANGAAFTYVPAADFHGPDAFTFDVSDGKLKSGMAIVGIAVRAVNDAPVAQPVALSTQEDVAAAGLVTATDVDGDALSYRISVPATLGDAAVDPRTGAVSYRPRANANGADGFTVEVSDGTLTATARAGVAIAAVYDAPIAARGSVETAEDTGADALLPGSDPDGEPLTFHLLSTPKLGTAELIDARTGAWRYVPAKDVNGDDELAFDVTDGTTTVKGTVTVKVAAVNDAPVLPGLTLATDEDRAVEAVLAGTDIDGDALTYAIAEQPKQGTCAISGDRVRFTPARDMNGAARCTVKVSDGKLSSAAAELAVAVAAVNDAPIALAGTLKTDEDLPMTGRLTGKDVDGDAITFAIARPPARGKLELIDAAKGSYVYTPNPDVNGADRFVFRATDPSGASSDATVEVMVAPVDDAPEAVAEAISVPVRGTITGRLHGFDRESKPLTYEIVEQPKNGRVKLVDSRTGDFVVSTDGSGGDQSFSFVVSDGALTSEPAELVLKVQNL